MMRQILQKEDEQETKRSTQNQKGPVIVIALDPKDGDEEFNKLSAVEKLKKVTLATKKAYDNVKAQRPDAKKIIVCWREHTITESTHKAVDRKFASGMKDVLKKLVGENPDLVIVAGGTLIKKEKASKEQYKQSILDNYQQYKTKFHSAIQELEDKDFNKYANKAIKVLKHNPNKSNTFTKAKNNAYVFYQDMKIRHGKLAPMHEFNRDKDLPERVFQLGKGPNGDSTIVRLPEVPSMCIQTCREHFFLDNDEDVDLQFILSNSIFPRADKMAHAKLAIYVDSLGGVKVFEMHKMDNVDVYQFNFLTDESLKLITPIQPLYFKLLPYIKKLEAEATNSHDLITQFKHLAENASTNTGILLKLGNLLGKLSTTSSFSMADFTDMQKIIHDHVLTIADSEQYAKSLIHLIDNQITEGKSFSLSNSFSNLYLSEHSPQSLFKKPNAPSSLPPNQPKEVTATGDDAFNPDEALYIEVSTYDGSSESFEKIKTLIAQGANPNYAADDAHPHITTLHVAQVNELDELIPLLKPRFSNSVR